MAAVIKMETCDEVIFDVDSKVASFFENIKIYPDSAVEGDEVIIQLPMKSHVLTKIITWVTHHMKSDLQAQMQVWASEEISSGDGWASRSKVYVLDEIQIETWDKEFVKDMDLGALIDLLQASKYLGVKRLDDIIAIAVANL